MHGLEDGAVEGRIHHVGESGTGGRDGREGRVREAAGSGPVPSGGREG